MNFLTSSILSGILWDVLKYGMKVNINYLRDKLSDWILEAKKLKKIVELSNNIPDTYLKSESTLKEYLDLNEDIQEILKSTQHNTTVINQQYNQGIAYGIVNGNVNNYFDRRKPKETAAKDFIITDMFTECHPIQIVESFSSIRKSCRCVYQDGDLIVKSEIFIPRYVRKQLGCQFSMLLFAFYPSENWKSYCEEDYSLEFDLITSKNILLVQLQIKNDQKGQFIDFPIKQGFFKRKLKEMTEIDAWQSIKEICFTIFANNDYIKNEKGTITIKNLRLTKS